MRIPRHGWHLGAAAWLLAASPAVVALDAPAPAPAKPAPAVAAPAAPALRDIPEPAAPPLPRDDEPRIGFEEDDLVRTPAADSLAGVWAMLVRGAVALSAVLLIIYFVLGKGMAKLAKKSGVGQHLQVVDRIGLDPKRTLYLVDVDGQQALLATSEHGVALAILPPRPKPDFKSALKHSAPESPGPSDPPPASLGDA